MLSIPKYPEQYAQHFPTIFYLLCCASQHHVWLGTHMSVTAVVWCVGHRCGAGGICMDVDAPGEGAFRNSRHTRYLGYLGGKKIALQGGGGDMNAHFPNPPPSLVAVPEP